ncbi:MAG: FAD-dependent oxidoreductase, partial [Nitrososphaerales archaeon]
PSSWDYSADVVVVGQGIAGCSAAITAHDAGARVIILDKAPYADYGNSGVCGGIAWYPCLSTNGGSVQDFITTLKAMTWGTTPDDELLAAYCQGIANLPAWYVSLGGAYVYAATVPTAIPRSLVTGLVSPSFQTTANWDSCVNYKTSTGATGNGATTMAFLGGCIASRNIPVLQSTPAEALIQNPMTREIIGVQASDWKGATLYIQADQGVILACGGYENNPEMTNNFEPWAHSEYPVSFWGTPYNTGDGIMMAQSVGAKLWHMNNKEWTSSGYSARAASNELGMGMTCSKGQSSTYCFMANRYGLRFMNEWVYSGHTAQLLATEQLLELNGEGSNVAPFLPQYDYLPTILPSGITLKSTDYVDYPNIPFYLIFDSQLLGAGALASGSYASAISVVHPTATYTWSPNNSVELAKGWIIGPAPDPTTLGNMIVSHDFQGRVVGMNAANLATTVTNFNAYAASGVDKDFGRPAAGMAPLNKPPYYAMELGIGRLNTNGGPVHDQYGRTIDVYGNPIPRLYSIGELGSLFGYLYYGGGNFPEGAVMGQYAGKHAASLPKYTQLPG